MARFCSLEALIVDVALPWLQVGCLSWVGFAVQVGDERLHPRGWRSDTQLMTCLCLQQDGRVGAPLAGLDVASHSVSWHLALIETKAAFLWARTTHTFTESDDSQHQHKHRQSETRSSHPDVSVHSVAVSESLSWAGLNCSLRCVKLYFIWFFYTVQK